MNSKPERRVDAGPSHEEQNACGAFYSQWYMEQHSKAQISKSSVPWQCSSLFDEKQARALEPKSVDDWVTLKKDMDEGFAKNKVGTHIEIGEVGKEQKE